MTQYLGWILIVIVSYISFQLCKSHFKKQYKERFEERKSSFTQEQWELIQEVLNI